MKKNINFKLKNEKVLVLSILTIQKLLLNTQMIWMIFIKHIEEYNPDKKQKVLIVFDGVIADIISNKNQVIY